MDHLAACRCMFDRKLVLTCTSRVILLNQQAITMGIQSAEVIAQKKNLAKAGIDFNFQDTIANTPRCTSPHSTCPGRTWTRHYGKNRKWYVLSFSPLPPITRPFSNHLMSFSHQLLALYESHDTLSLHPSEPSTLQRDLCRLHRTPHFLS